jgi:hypothetical protein
MSNVIELFSRNNIPVEDQLVVITEEEALALVDSLEDPVDEKAIKLIQWAESVRISNEILEMLLDKMLTVDIAEDGEPVFSAR